MTNTPKDVTEIALRLHRLTGLTDTQIGSLSLTLDPAQVDSISDSALASLVNGTLPGLPLNASGGLPLGLPGATAGARFAGGTTSGAPTSGTFLVRDWVVTGSGTFYVCTTAGSPGTWVQVSGGGGGGAVSSVAGKTGAVSLVKADVGLGNVDNTSDATKQTANDARYVQTSQVAPLTNTTPQTATTGAGSAGTAAEAMRADAVIPLPAGLGGTGSFYGSGVHGDAVLDGTSTPNPAGGYYDVATYTTEVAFTRSGSVYTMQKSLFFHNLTINSGVTLNTAGFLLFVSGTLTNNGTIDFSGGDASGATAGASPAVALTGVSQYHPLGLGSSGTAGTVSGATANQTSFSSPGFIGGKGGVGGTGSAGTGGAVPSQGVAFNVSLVSGSLIFATTGLLILVNGASFSSGNYLGPAWGGIGGTGGGGDATNAGGGAGGGGGVIILNVKTLVNNGAISANGGNGAAGVAGNTGGGGGGGGGAVLINTTSTPTGSGTVTATGGTFGAASGSGTAGSAGTAGRTYTTVWA